MKNQDSVFSQFKKETLNNYSPTINRAYKLAEYAHTSQHQTSQSSYLKNQLWIMNHLRAMGFPTETLVIALLHDVVENTTITIKDVEELFNQETALTIYFLSKDSVDSFKDEKSRDTTYLQKLEAGFCYHYNVYVVKLVDKLHTISTLQNIKPDDRYFKIKETLTTYVPLFKKYLHVIPEKHYNQCKKIITDMDETISDYIKEL